MDAFGGCDVIYPVRTDPIGDRRQTVFRQPNFQLPHQLTLLAKCVLIFGIVNNSDIVDVSEYDVSHFMQQREKNLVQASSSTGQTDNGAVIEHE